MKLSIISVLFLSLISISCSNAPLSESRAESISNNKFMDRPKPKVEQRSNTAIVISRHANLRDSDNVSATVLQVIPQDSSVEVIKQQGAWFYVKTETIQGWLHGNTLKLQNFEINSKTSLKPAATPRLPQAPDEMTAAGNSEETSAQTDLKIKGNKNSMIYHLPGCASYGRIAAHNIVWFKTGEEAEAAGYRMARNC